MKIEFKIKERNYVLSSDDRQFVLAIETNSIDSRTNKNRLTDHCYFTKIEYLLDTIYQLGLKNNTVNSFRELAKHSDEVKEIVRGIAKQMSYTS